MVLICFALSMLIGPALISCSDEDQELVGKPSPRQDRDKSLIIFYSELTGLTEHTGLLSDPDRSVYPFDYRAIPFMGTRQPKLRTSIYENKHIVDFNGKKVEKRKVFYILRELNNDTTFQESPHYKGLYHNTFLQGVWIQDFVDIRVEAVTDYDETHPAGSSLSEIAYLTYASCYDFIQKGYRFDNGEISNGVYLGLIEYSSELEKRSMDEDIDATERKVKDDIDYYTYGYGSKTHDSEFISHRRVSDIAADPLKCVMGHNYYRMLLSFAIPPAQPATVRMTIYLKDRIGFSTTTTVTREMNLRP